MDGAAKDKPKARAELFEKMLHAGMWREMLQRKKLAGPCIPVIKVANLGPLLTSIHPRSGIESSLPEVMNLKAAR